MIQRPGDVGKGIGFFIENRQTRRIRSFFGVTPGLIRDEVDGMLAESQTCGEKPTRYPGVIHRRFASPSPHHPPPTPSPANADAPPTPRNGPPRHANRAPPLPYQLARKSRHGRLNRSPVTIVTNPAQAQKSPHDGGLVVLWASRLAVFVYWVLIARALPDDMFPVRLAVCAVFRN